MAQTPRSPLAMQSFGRALTKLAKTKPATPRDIELEMYRTHGFRISDDTIRKAHRGEVDPGKCNLDVLVALMAFYECGPGDLGEAAAKALAPMLSVVGWAPESPDGLGVSPTGCNGEVVDLGARRAALSHGATYESEIAA